MHEHWLILELEAIFNRPFNEKGHYSVNSESYYNNFQYITDGEKSFMTPVDAPHRNIIVTV
jgi:hypothetical protein